MSDHAPSPPEGAAERTSAHLSWGATLPLLLLVAIIAAGVVGGVMVLRRQSDEAQRQQLVLTTIRLRASELSTLAARTMEERRLSSISDEAYRRLSIELRMLTSQARMSPLLRENALLVDSEYSVRADIEAGRFAAAVEDEFAWLRLGKIEEAQKIDHLRVRPSYDDLSATVQAALESYDGRAGRIVKAAGIGTSLLSVLGLGSIVVLLLGSARQYARQARAERTSLAKANEVLREENERRRRTEEALALARNKAEELARLKDTFLASMSHEIRTPLMAILGYSELLREQAPPELQDYADQIETGGHRLLDTLTSVLDFAKIEAGQMQPSFTVVDASGVARGVESELKGLAGRKGLFLCVETPDGPVNVRGDSGFVHRSLYNLVSNAVKFTERGEVRISVRNERGMAVLRVRDTGPGISEAFLPHLFEEFRQESAGETRRHEGSGLGLAITRRLAECMNGTVEVETRLGVGTCFTMRLPIAHEVTGETRPVPGETRPVPGDGAPHRAAELGLNEGFSVGIPFFSDNGAPPTLLLVEDNPSSASAIGLMLAAYRVDFAATYDEAISKARAGHYDLFLIDINLRESRTGVDVLQSVRRLPRYSATPAIALTAYALPGDQERFLQVGFEAYLSKPFRKGELLGRITELTGHAASFDAHAPQAPEVDVAVHPSVPMPARGGPVDA